MPHGRHAGRPASNTMNKLQTAALTLLIALTLAAAPARSACSIGEAKRDLPDGAMAEILAVSVTAVFPGGVYVEQHDRVQGIRVVTDQTLAEGDVVDVYGQMLTDTNGERCVAALPEYPMIPSSTHALQPLHIGARAFVGGSFGLQEGMAGEAGLNTIGLLVTVSGPVSGFDSAIPGSWFVIGGPAGPEIKIVAPQEVKIDRDAQYVVATGICTVEKVDGVMKRVLKVRRQSDIVSHQSWAEGKVQTLTLDEKVGQVFQVRVSGSTLTETDRAVIADKHIGGVIYFQWNGNLDDPTEAAQLSNDLQTAALGVGGTGIPLLISLDQEGGRVTRITGGAQFPGNMGIGASRSAELARLTGSVFGAEISAIGANMDLAPVLDVNNNPANPVIGVRSFGEDPALAAEMGIGYLQGLHEHEVIACAKHFPGHGDTNVDSHSGLPVVTYDFDTLDTIHGRPFREAIAAGLDTIMTAHIVVTCLDPDRPATLSPLVIDGYLRANLGFDGVVMTDSMGMAGVTSGYGVDQSAVMAIQAGVDMLSLSPDLDTAMAAVKAAVISGAIPQARLDQAVMRILRLKRQYGLFENPFVDTSAAAGIVGCQEHWNAEVAVARGAMTLVQNTGGVLPLNLNESDRVLLVTVQSSAETTTDAAARFASFITAQHANTESLAISENPTRTARNTVKNAATSADVVIIATAHAEAYSGQVTLINDLLAMPKPVIAVGLREPYEFAAIPGVTAYLAAYNYRNCGFAAAADVIFGVVNPSGLLPVTIPGLYAFGHGLSY